MTAEQRKQKILDIINVGILQDKVYHKNTVLYIWKLTPFCTRQKGADIYGYSNIIYRNVTNKYYKSI